MGLLRWSGYLFVVLLGVTAVVMGMGSRLPAEHVATATGAVGAPVERVWGLIADVAGQPGWRTGLKAVEVTSSGVGEAGPCWTEVGQMMRVPLCVVASEAPAVGRAGRRVVRIADPRLPFGGTWTYVVEEAGPERSRVTITEDERTGPAMWRFVGHYVTGEDTGVKQYLQDLAGAAERKG